MQLQEKQNPRRPARGRISSTFGENPRGFFGARAKFWAQAEFCPREWPALARANWLLAGRLLVTAKISPARRVHLDPNCGRGQSSGRARRQIVIAGKLWPQAALWLLAGRILAADEISPAQMALARVLPAG